MIRFFSVRIKKYLIFVNLLFKIIILKIRYPSVKFIRSNKIEGRAFSQDGQDLFVLPIISCANSKYATAPLDDLS